MNRTDTFRKEVRKVLESNILNYWLTLKDPRGGFFGEADGTGEIQRGAPRGVILNARIIWAFSAAYGMLHDSRYLEAAIHAKDWFLAHFCDGKNGGVFWSVTAAGEPLDEKKQLYAQGFAIYGLSELYKVSSDEETLRAAIDLFRVVEAKFRDAENGGYIEALARDFSPLEDMSLSAHDINADKTMNSHLHILEAYANLYQVWPDPSLKKAVEELLDIVCNKVMGPDGHLRLYFRRDWSVLPGGVSYGHDIETSWLALECASALHDIDVVNRVRPAALLMGKAGNEGYRADGSMMYEKLEDGSLDLSRQWWVLAEAVVGNLWLWKFHGDLQAPDRALATWAYIRDNIVDWDNGEWFWGVHPDGTPDKDSPKAGFWKCPYHNTRMCLQVLSLV
ncbi:MAG: AGE family epimerase/isomerase [Bacteroidales bacterium]|nr:AGE family epimerase/isomerase [Bacteroidales bacterium]